MPRSIFLAAAILILAGCASPQKIEKARADAQIFDAERQAREANQQCSEAAMPGTVQHMACRLTKTNGSQ